MRLYLVDFPKAKLDRDDDLLGSGEDEDHPDNGFQQPATDPSVAVEQQQ